MKKVLFGFVAVFMMAVICVGLSACSSDDSNGAGGGSGNLVGTWRLVSEVKTYYTKADGQWKETDRKEEDVKKDDQATSGFIFYADGKARLIFIKGDGTYELETDDWFKYKLENGNLFLIEEDPKDNDGWELWGACTVADNTMQIKRDRLEKKGYVTVKTYRKM
jgi:hypothetical protein